MKQILARILAFAMVVTGVLVAAMNGVLEKALKDAEDLDKESVENLEALVDSIKANLDPKDYDTDSWNEMVVNVQHCCHS